MKAIIDTSFTWDIFGVSLLIHGCDDNENNKQTKKQKKKFLVLEKIILFFRGTEFFCSDNLGNLKYYMLLPISSQLDERWADVWKISKVSTSAQANIV